MEHGDAVGMLRRDAGYGSTPRVWADLGCGTGTFTRALAELLPSGSLVHAMDRDGPALAQVPEEYAGVRITKRSGDIVLDPFPARDLDGILLANALHYVSDRTAFLTGAVPCLKPDGVFLFVEYDTDVRNAWVPYPVTFASLKESLDRIGFATVRLHQRPSVFRRAMLYSAVAYR